MPVSLPCVDYALVWHTAGRAIGASGGGGGGAGGGGATTAISVWRPLPPAGYAPAGDVAVAGLDPPPDPVAVYRLDAGAAVAAPGGDETAAADAPPTPLPPAAPAAGFRLVWRDSGGLPVTLWEPRPPAGYAAVGCVARGSPSPPRGWRARARALARPPAAEVACLRADLVEAAPPGPPAPLWQWDPAAGAGAGLGAASAPPSYDPSSWRVAVWPVEGSAAGTFIAERSFDRPREGVAVRPRGGGGRA